MIYDTINYFVNRKNNIILKHQFIYIGYVLDILILLIFINQGYLTVILYLLFFGYYLMLKIIINNAYSYHKQSTLTEENIKKYATKIKCPTNIEIEI